jgi:L-threonylcarbamoyladenylate synthase
VILKTDPDRPATDVLDLAARALREGGLVVAPTETRYGLLARADRQEIVEKLYRLKEREFDHPTALLARDADEMRRMGKVSRAADLLIAQLLPGPLTLVLESLTDWPPPRVVDGKIGLRWSPAETVEGLLARVDFPVTATSANISGRTEQENVEGIESDLGDGVASYIDIGRLTGKTSTVVDCTSDRPVILREGAIANNEIRRVVGDIDG